MPDDQIFDDKTRAEMPVDFKSSGPRFSKSIIIYSAIAVVLVVGIFWYFLRSGPSAHPTSTNVVLQLKGPDQLTSGNEAEYHVVYRNGENADLVGITLEMFYPESFKFKSAEPVSTSSSGQTFNLPVLKQGQDGEVIIRGKLTGATGEDKEIKAKLHYRLSNFNSEFVVEQSIHTSILPPNVTMEVNGPVDVVNGQDTTFIVNFTNVTVQDFDNLAVQLTYPDGFSFTSSQPVPSKANNYWTIPKLAAGSSSSINITGSFTGDASQDKLVRADLGQIINNTFAPQIVSTATFKIIPSSLSLVVTADPTNYVTLGQVINYTLDYANRGSIGLNNLLIVVNFDSPALDFSRVNASDAIVSGHTLTWKAASQPSLAVLSPNETGQIKFTIPVRQTLPSNLTNQTISAQGSIASDEISKPTKAANVDLKLATALNLTINGDYLSGSAPMQVGKPTLFAITFSLSNLSNDVSNTNVVASMPLPTSAWKNVVIPDSEKSRLSFDPNSGKITWAIGTLPAFTGKFIPVLKATFQIEVTPTDADHNKPINLLTNIQASGQDSFVDIPVQTPLINTYSTSDVDDSFFRSKGGGSVQ